MQLLRRHLKADGIDARFVLAVAAALFMLLGVLGVAARGSGPAAATETQPPNIVLVVTDDQTMDSMIAMPFLTSKPDGHWVEFSNAFLSTSLCCPSRATILTGQYSWHHGVVNASKGRDLDESATLATWLDGAGYRTGLMGKYLNDYPFDRGPYVPPGWDDWVAFDGFPNYFGYTLNHNGTLEPHGAAEADYSTDVLRDEAVAFLGEPSAEPFFLLFTPAAPHAPYTPPPRHQDAFSGVPIPHSPNFNEADVSDKPAWIRALGTLSPKAQADLDTNSRNAYRTMLAVDEAIEAMFDTLEAAGKLDNTVFVFMTDNGLSVGSHRFRQKTCVYEECIRTPLLVRYPAGASRVEDRLVSNIDLASTITELAQTSPTIPQDGTSLVPLLDDSVVSWRDNVVLGFAGAVNVPPYVGLRTDSFKYVELASGERELYDLVNDPYELVNVAGQGAYAETEADLASKLDAYELITLDLAPDTLVADGISTSTATVTVTDVWGAAANAEVTLESSGDTQVSAPVQTGPGVYEATITASTTPGDETLTASTPAAVTTSAVLHEVPQFSVTSVDPPTIAQGTTVTRTIQGNGFVSGATVASTGGVTVKSVTFVDASTLSVRFKATTNAALGPRNVTVTNPGGGSRTCSACLTVTARPAPTSVTPSSLPVGAPSQIVVVNGSGFAPGLTASFSTRVKVESITFVSATRLDVRIRVLATASPGPRTVKITNPDGASGTCSCFAVT